MPTFSMVRVGINNIKEAKDWFRLGIMSDNIYDYTLAVQKRNTKPICRVAYTLNNTQPVACTIIDEQPLFYMDYDESYDEELLDSDLVDTEFDAAAFGAHEEEFFTESDLNMLRDEIRTLKDQLHSIEKFSADFVETDELYLERLHNNVRSCTSLGEKDETTIDHYLAILGQSRLAKEYLDLAQDKDIRIALSNQIEQAEYNRQAGTIFVNPNQDEADIVLQLAAELRRHWQHREGALINPLLFHPDQAVLINRAQIADISTSMVRIAWELQLAGYRQTWERMENGPTNDLARAFAREAFLDFRTINNGEAAAAVFEAWFLSERCRSYDKTLIQQMLNDEKGYVFDMGEMSRSITPDLIAALGTMPYGKNYLASHVETIMNDPVFTDVRDRSNANFLWFIKFERSYKETEKKMEQGLQKGDSNKTDQPTAPETLHGATAKPKTNSNGTADHEQTAQLIPFPGLQTGAKPATKTKRTTGKRLSGKRTEQSGDGAEIIYLRRWSGE